MFALGRLAASTLPPSHAIEELAGKSHEFFLECDLGGVVRWADARAEHLLGVALGVTLHELCVGDAASRVSTLFDMARTKPVDGFELDVLAGGSPRTVLFSAVRSPGETIVLLGALEPLRAPLACEAQPDRHELRPRRSTASSFDEMESSKNAFLAMLAHELRNPLAAISASLAVLEQAPVRGERDATARDVGRRQIDHLVRLVDGMLDVSRVMCGIALLERRPVRLLDVVVRAVEASRVWATESKGQRIELVVDEAESVLVDGDPVHLEQSLVNLLDNASKFSPDKARIRVLLAMRRADGAPVARIVVSDDGDGIDDETLPRIFDLFFQGSVSSARLAGGLGLGLAVVRHVVELHGGRVIAQSAGPGKGTTIEVTLPTLSSVEMRPTVRAPLGKKKEAREQDRGVAEQGAPARRPLQVLLVEDNEDVAETMSELLSMWGHEVARARDGFEGVNVATSRAFDVALIDVGLPGVDGCEIARRVRAHPRARTTRLVALTGYGSSEVRMSTREAGFDRHLVKPPDPKELRALLDETPRVELWDSGSWGSYAP